MIVLACWLPALKAARMTPIQAIRQPQKVKLKRRHRFLSFAAGKLWGIEGELAVKNIQRSGRKAGLTILSLAVSLILFTTVTSVMTMMIQAVSMTSQDELADAWVTDYSSHSFLEEKMCIRDSVLNRRVNRTDLIRDSCDCSHSVQDS